jgi:hypothetical protein
VSIQHYGSHFANGNIHLKQLVYRSTQTPTKDFKLLEFISQQKQILVELLDGKFEILP